MNLFIDHITLYSFCQQNDSLQVSFHLPLHRYLSVFMCQAIKHQGLTLKDVLPPRDVLMLIMMHPLRVQVGTLFHMFITSLCKEHRTVCYKSLNIFKTLSFITYYVRKVSDFFFFFAKTWQISMKRTCRRWSWTFIWMRGFFPAY